MKRDFEEYFPLPWTVIETKNGAFMVPNTETLTTEHWFKRSLKDGLIETFSTNAFPPRVAALKHAVLCVNLMPEAVEVIRDLIGIAAVLDYGADNAVTRAKQLLAKLEGGADDNAQNP